MSIGVVAISTSATPQTANNRLEVRRKGRVTGHRRKQHQRKSTASDPSYEAPADAYSVIERTAASAAPTRQE